MAFILSLASFFMFILYIYFGVYVFKMGIKEKKHQAFLALTLSFAVWALGYTFIFSAGDIKAVWLWYRFTIIGWAVMPAIVLHFCVLLTQSDRVKKTWLLYLLYIPSIIITLRGLTGYIFVIDFIPVSYGWREVIDASSIWLWIYTLYALIFPGIGIFLIWRWGIRTLLKKEKKQSQIIAAAAVVSLTLSLLSNLILPVSGIKNIPALGHILSGIWVVGLWIAIVKYKFLILTPYVAVDKIMSKMTGLLLLLNPDGIINRVNRRVNETLGFNQSELIGKPFLSIVYEKEKIEKMLKNVRKNEKSKSKEFNFINDRQLRLPVNLSLSIFKDTIGDVLGYIAIAHDISEMKKMEAFIEEKMKMEVELRYAHHELGLNHRELEAERNKLKFRNESMENELAMARKIQVELIPSKSPLENLAFLYKPMYKIGGDFYDFVKFESKNEIGIFLSDVSGHGVPAAFITNMIKSYILQHGEIIDNPAEFLFFLNDFLLNKTGGNFITAFYGIYNPEKKFMTYASAGHNSPYLISNDELRQLSVEGRGFPLGILSNQEIALNNKEYSNNTFQFESGMKLLLYTDGLTEAANIYDKDRLFGEEDLDEIIMELKDYPSREFVNKLFEKVVDFCQSNNFEDDICIICLGIE